MNFFVNCVKSFSDGLECAVSRLRLTKGLCAGQIGMISQTQSLLNKIADESASRVQSSAQPHSIIIPGHALGRPQLGHFATSPAPPAPAEAQLEALPKAQWC